MFVCTTEASAQDDLVVKLFLFVVDPDSARSGITIHPQLKFNPSASDTSLSHNVWTEPISPDTIVMTHDTYSAYVLAAAFTDLWLLFSDLAILLLCVMCDYSSRTQSAVACGFILSDYVLLTACIHVIVSVWCDRRDPDGPNYFDLKAGTINKLVERMTMTFVRDQSARTHKPFLYNSVI